MLKAEYIVYLYININIRCIYKNQSAKRLTFDQALIVSSCSYYKIQSKSHVSSTWDNRS